MSRSPARKFIGTRIAEMPAVCRVGDSHACGDTDTTGSPNVFCNGMPVHRLGDQHAHIATQIEASPNVFVNGRGVARIGDDQSADEWFHPPNPQTTGSPNVFANGK